MATPPPDYDDWAHVIWLTVQQAAVYAQVHEKTIRTWVREGKLRHGSPTSRVTRIKRVWLDEFLENGGDQ